MHSVQVQPVTRLPLAEHSRIGQAYATVKALFAAIGARHHRAIDGVVPNYEGRAWCDSTERQVITGIATCRRTAI